MPFVSTRIHPIGAALLLLLLGACAGSAPGPDRASAPPPEETYVSEEEYENATFDEDTIVDEATDFLGAGAEDVARAIEDLFKKNGRPNAYIAGSEAGGGFIVGLRYGGGTLAHKIEGSYPIHWTGPSIGVDFGADAAKTFSLVYNLHDSEEIYKRIAAVEGSIYFVGGLGISYYQGKYVKVATVRLGAGLRAQASLGYVKYTKKRNFNPF